MAAKPSFQILIPKRANQCAKGEAKFEPGDAYYSLVLENENEEQERFDYCTRCWKEVERKGGVHWRGKVPKRKEKAKYADLSRDERAMALFRDALSEQRDDEAFVLGLYLSRQRRLLVRKIVKGQQLYEIASSEEVVGVPILELSTQQVEEVQQRLAEKMKG